MEIIQLSLTLRQVLAIPWGFMCLFPGQVSLHSSVLKNFEIRKSKISKNVLATLCALCIATVLSFNTLQNCFL